MSINLIVNSEIQYVKCSQMLQSKHIRLYIAVVFNFGRENNFYVICLHLWMVPAVLYCYMPSSNYAPL